MCPHGNKRYSVQVPLPGIHLLHSDWSAGCRWSRQGVASFRGCCCSKGALLTLPLPRSMLTPPCLIPWKKHVLTMKLNTVCLCFVSWVCTRFTIDTSPVMCGGQLAWGTLQVLLEAKVKGLADGADDILGQTVRALQDVARWWGSEQHI